MARTVTAAGARELTTAVNQLRRALRRAVRLDPRWAARPVAQVEVLQALRESGAVRLSELATRLNLAQSTVSGLISALAADALVAREVDTRDRRAMLLDLAPEGRALLAEWDAAHRTRLAGALRSLDAEDRTAVLAAVPALGRLAAALNAQRSGD